ncbi:uncharacterized protein LOC142339535 isoform X2 [Convolutriloba macropyga]
MSHPHHYHGSGSSSGSGGGGGSSGGHSSVTASANLSAANQAMMMAGGSASGMTSHLAGAGSASLAGAAAGASGGSEIKPPKKPEKPMSSYMRYNKSVHERIKAENPQMKMWDIAKIIGQMWRELPDSEKQVLNEEYEIDKARYNEEMKAYYNSPAYQTYLQLKNREKQLQEQHSLSAAANSSTSGLLTSSDPRSLLNESKMTITPAIDDEDLDEDGFGLKHLAAARYRRNNRLILDIFSDFHVNTTQKEDGGGGAGEEQDCIATAQPIVTVSRLKALQSQVEALIEHENERIDELVEMEKKHQERKRKIEESRQKFEAEWDQLSAKRFNWMTTTEAELKEIKSWFKETYGLDTGGTVDENESKDSSDSANVNDEKKDDQSSSERETTSSSVPNVQSNNSPDKTSTSSTDPKEENAPVAKIDDTATVAVHQNLVDSTYSYRNENPAPSRFESQHYTSQASNNLYGVPSVRMSSISGPPSNVSETIAGPVPSSAFDPSTVVSANETTNVQLPSACLPGNKHPQDGLVQGSAAFDESLDNLEADEPRVEVKERQKDPDYVPMSEDSNLGMDEDSTDVPPTSEDEEEEQLQPSDISSTGEHAEA